MAIPVVETFAISNQTSNATSKSDVTSPASVANNDIVLIFIAIDGDAANPEANADGFATLTSFPEGADEIYVLWKRSTGGEPANYTVNWTGSEQARFMTVRVSGCITTGDPWDIISAGVSNAASVDNVINRLTSTVVDTLAIYAVAVDRDRVDGADTITGTGWTEVGTSGSSGGANGAGLIVGENDMPTVEQVEAGTFGTWASDQNASRGFNLKPPAGGPQNFERTASQSLTHSESVARAGSTFNRTGITVLTHIDSVARSVGFPRTVSQILTHIDNAIREGSTFNRVASTILTHIDSVVRAASTFSRTVAQLLTHSDVAVSDAQAVTVTTRRPKVSAIRPLQRLADEITEERLTVFLKVTLFKQELVSTRITNTFYLKLHQRETLTTKLAAPEQWLAKDHIKSALILTLKQKDKLFSTFRVKLRESLKPSQEANIRLKTAKVLQELRDSLANKDKRIKHLADHVLKLNETKDIQAERLEKLQKALIQWKAGTMSAEDVLALFASSD